MAWAGGDGEPEAGAAAAEPTLRAPPQRKDSHGGNKHKRKTKQGRGRGSGSATLGRLSTRSSANTAAEKKVKRLTCAKCSKAGRTAPEFNVTNHRGHSCPYEKVGRIETIDLTKDDDDDDMPLAQLWAAPPPSAGTASGAASGHAATGRAAKKRRTDK